MNDISIAFQTVVVGLFAFPWLILLLFNVSYIFDRCCEKNPMRRLYETYLPIGEKSGKEISGPLFGFILIALTYLLGSILSPGADELFNHNVPPSWVSQSLPWRLKTLGVRGDDCIKLRTYHEYYRGRPALLDSAGFPAFLRVEVNELAAATRTELSGRYCESKRLEQCVVTPIYTYQKYFVYNYLASGGRSLERMDDQIVVLRGAALNGLITLVLCLAILVTRTIMRISRRPRFRAAPHSDVGEKLESAPLRSWRLGPATGQLTAIALVGAVLLVTGAYGWEDAESEFNKDVIGFYHGVKPSDLPGNDSIHARTASQNMASFKACVRALEP